VIGSRPRATTLARVAVAAAIVGFASAVLLDFGGLTEREGSFPNYRYVDHDISLFSEAAAFVVLGPLATLFAIAAIVGHGASRKAARGDASRINSAFWVSVAAGAVTTGAAILLALVGEEDYFSWWLDVGFYLCLVAAGVASVSFAMLRQSGPGAALRD
jgi:hypothetical protein